MARVPLVEPGSRPELAGLEQRLLGARGRISPLYQVLMHSEPIASGWEQLLTAVRQRTTVPPDLRELAMLRIAVLNDAAFEFDAHVPHARHAGLDEAKIEAVRGAGIDAGIHAVFDARERLVLELTDAMTRDVTVPPALMDRVQAQYDDRAVVELVATIASYNMVSRLLVALQVGH